MNMISHNNQPDLPRSLLSRILPIAAPLRPGIQSYDERLFSYCCIDRERIVAIKLPHPIIGIVLHGTKEIWLGEHCQTFLPGSVFVLPREVSMDAVNIPDDRSGLYASLCLQITGLPNGIAPLSPSERQNHCDNPKGFLVDLTPDLVEALCHAATAIAGDLTAETIKRLRITEVLTLLRPVHGARALFHPSLSEEVAWLVGGAPSEPWSVDDVARQLKLGASTLRRRLASEGTSFRAIIREQRLKAGSAALASGASSLAAAEAAGYVSRSHFSRRYRESFGTTPTGR